MVRNVDDWYIACAENVANMLENCISPTMRVTNSGMLAWLDEEQTMVQATQDIAVPNSDGLFAPKVCIFRSLLVAVRDPLHVL